MQCCQVGLQCFLSLCPEQDLLSKMDLFLQMWGVWVNIYKTRPGNLVDVSQLQMHCQATRYTCGNNERAQCATTN